MTRTPPSSSPPQPAETIWSAGDLAADPHACSDKADRVRRMFSSIAGRYDLNNRLHSLGLDQRWRRLAVSMCNVRTTDHVLDVACGTGDLTEAFARKCPASITGVDFTEPMLEIAREKAADRRADWTEPVYRWGDATNLELPDGSVDVVSIAFGIRNVDDVDQALREFRRVLRADGRLLVLEFSEPKNRVIRSLNRLYTNRIMPVTASLIAGDRTGAYRYLPSSVDQFLTAEALSDRIRAAGFDRATAQPLTFGVCTAHLGHV